MSNHPLDRRMFLGRAASAALLAPVVTLLGCGRAGDTEGGTPAAGSDHGEGPRASDGAARRIERPVLLPFSENAVHLWAPPAERPLAYVSMAAHRIFVERSSRDRVYWLLDAHISVSSGLWRIPLPGDDPRVPIVPDDRLREFEEQPMRAWDPTAPPAEGDMRILRGVPGRVRLELACAPLAGGGSWIGSDPLDFVRCAGGATDACREDFMDVGRAGRFADRRCAEPTGPVRVLTWACR